MSREELLTAAYDRLGRSPLAVAAALRLRGISRAIIGQHLSQGADATRNGEERLIRVLAPGVRTFADVGANVGDWSAELLAAAPDDARGLLLDPSPVAAERLRERFSGEDGVEVLEAAAGERTGEAVLHEEADAGVMSSLVAGLSAQQTAARSVPVVVLDEELGRRGLDRLDLLKVDAEGYDLRVLKGASRLLAEHRVPVVQFEYQHGWARAGSTLGEADAWLRSLGYRLSVLRSDGLFDLDYDRFGEFLFLANIVAALPEAHERIQAAWPAA